MGYLEIYVFNIFTLVINLNILVPLNISWFLEVKTHIGLILSVGKEGISAY